MISLHFRKGEGDKTICLIKGNIDDNWYKERFVSCNFYTDEPIKSNLQEFLGTNGTEVELILYKFLTGPDKSYPRMSEEKARTIIDGIKKNINNPFRHFTIGNDCEVFI